MAGELSSDLLNQQLNEVRLDKDNILERLQIAETARFELQKMVTTLKEKHEDHVSSIDEKFEDSKVSNYRTTLVVLVVSRYYFQRSFSVESNVHWFQLNVQNITEEFHKCRDTEISRIQGIHEKTLQLENRLTEFENEKSNSTNDLSALIERDEYTKKSLAKVFTKVDEMDAKLDSVASGKFGHQF